MRTLMAEVGNVRQLLAAHPSLLGEDVGKVLTKNPDICLFEFSKLDENLKLLLDSKFPVSTIRKNVQVLAMPPWVLRDYLARILQYGDMEVMFHHPKFLKVFANIDQFEIRLSALQKGSSPSFKTLYGYSNQR